MGFIFSKLWDMLSTAKEYRIIMLGLDGAGKSTILSKMKLGETQGKTVPTIGFNYESLIYKNIKLNVWDIGGQSKFRALWKHYFINVRAMIYVIDSSDEERIEEAKDALHMILHDEELIGVPIIVMANKKDLKLLNKKEIEYKLALDKIIGRNWGVESTCALNGEGVTESLDWIAKELNNQ